MRTSDQINEVIAALAKARPKFGAIKKTATGQVGQNRNYKYAPLGGIVDSTVEALAEQGLVVVQMLEAETSTLVTMLAHASGQWIASAYPLKPYDRPQDYGSQLTYGRRYSYAAILNLSTEEDDDAQSLQTEPAPASPPKPAAPPPKPGKITAAQQKKFFAVAGTHKWPHPVLKAWLGTMNIAHTNEIPKDSFDDILAALEGGPSPELVAAVKAEQEQAEKSTAAQSVAAAKADYPF